MNFSQLCQQRRSVHHYLPNKTIEQNLWSKVFELVRLTPSGYNAQPWEFLVIEDMKRREHLQSLSFGQKQITEASAVVLVLGDANIGRRSKETMADWVKYGHAKVESAATYQASMEKERSLNQRKMMARRSTCLAAMTFMYACQYYGLATCPMMGFEQQKVAKWLALPEDIFPVMMITVGYEDESKRLERLPRREIEDFVHWEKLGDL